MWTYLGVSKGKQRVLERCLLENVSILEVDNTCDG